jgi:hypothetical protein
MTTSSAKRMMARAWAPYSHPACLAMVRATPGDKVRWRGTTRRPLRSGCFVNIVIAAVARDPSLRLRPRRDFLTVQFEGGNRSCPVDAHILAYFSVIVNKRRK